MPQQAIKFFSQDINYRLEGINKVRDWLNKALGLENKSVTNLSYVFCSDSYLLKLNIDFLNHDTLTDVITFDMSVDKNGISGEIYISIDRVRDNAKKYGVSINVEIKRVIVHGLLHLIGYADNTKEDKAIMREKEDYYLSFILNN